MKKFPFILLDTGPIIKLFELGIWDTFLQRCDVTIPRTVVDEAKWASQAYEDVRVELDSYEQQGLIQIVDVELSQVKAFYDTFDQQYKSVIDPGEKEALAFLCNSSDNWRLCSADHAVFRVLGLMGKAEQGISLEEVFKAIGLSQNLEWQYTKKFREHWARQGEIDFVQDRGRKKRP